MTLTNADYARTEPSYAWRCASCARLFATNRPPDPPQRPGEDWLVEVGRTPIDAASTRELALLCCAVFAQDRPDLHVGFWTRPARGALAVRVTGPRLQPAARARAPLDLALVFVARGDGEVWTAPKREWRATPSGYLGQSDTQSRITGYRLDVFIDEDRENRREYFTTLLAGLRLEPYAGNGPHGPYPSNENAGFVLERLRYVGDGADGGDDDEEDVMFHASVSPSVDLVIPPRQGFHVSLNYGLAPGLGGHPSPIPIGFMRVVVLGETTRDTT